MTHFPMMMRALTIGVLLLVGSTGASVAGAEEATSFIHQQGEQVLDVLRDDALPAPEKERKLVDIFGNSVDVKWVGRFVLGKYWRRASDEQKARYNQYYRPFLLHSYASRFNEYRGETFDVSDANPLKKEGEYEVRTRILRPQGEPVQVNYRVRPDESGNHFLIFDVVVEGVSLLATQRSEFAALIDRKGLDHLIDRLEARSKEYALLPTETASK